MDLKLSPNEFEELESYKWDFESDGNSLSCKFIYEDREEIYNDVHIWCFSFIEDMLAGKKTWESLDGEKKEEFKRQLSFCKRYWDCLRVCDTSFLQKLIDYFRNR